jgi:hypothetical protein
LTSSLINLQFHKVWGQLMKTGYQNSRFAHQVRSMSFHHRTYCCFVRAFFSKMLGQNYPTFFFFYIMKPQCSFRFVLKCLLHKQVERFACLYTSQVSNLSLYSPNKYYRPGEDFMPHEFNILPMWTLFACRLQFKRGHDLIFFFFCHGKG